MELIVIHLNSVKVLCTDKYIINFFHSAVILKVSNLKCFRIGAILYSRVPGLKFSELPDNTKNHKINPDPDFHNKQFTTLK